MIELNPTVGSTPNELKYEDVPFEGMGFKINGSDYHYVGLMVESQASVRWVLKPMGGDDDEVHEGEEDDNDGEGDDVTKSIMVGEGVAEEDERGFRVFWEHGFGEDEEVDDGIGICG